MYHVRGVATRERRRGGGPVLHKLWARVEAQARFCSNCGTPRPTSPLTKAEPAPTFTPAEILASEKVEEEAAREQAAEAQPEVSPEPVHETEADVPHPGPVAEPIVPAPDEQAGEGGPEASDAETARDRTGLTVALLVGLPFAAIGLGLGGVDASVTSYFVVVVIVRLVQWEVRLVQWDRRRREREKLRSASVPTAAEMEPTHGLDGEGGLSRVPTPEADVAVPPLPERTAERVQEKPPPEVGAGAPSDRTGQGGDIFAGQGRDIFAASCSGLILVALVYGFLLAGGGGLAVEWAVLVFIIGAAIGSSGQKSRKRVVRAVPTTRSRSIPQWVKIAVATRDGGACRRCGSSFDLQYDHVIPFSRGGSSTEVNNIQLLCGRCNRRKSNRYVG